MVKIYNKHKHINSFLALFLFSIFAISSLFVLLNGADLVKKFNERDQKNYNQRTAAQYLAMRVHQSDQNGIIITQDFNGCDTLVLLEEHNGIQYHTLVYCYDGYLRELFTESDMDMDPSYGTALIPMDSLSIRYHNSLLNFELIFPDGEMEFLNIYLRSEGGHFSEK